MNFILNYYYLLQFYYIKFIEVVSVTSMGSPCHAYNSGFTEPISNLFLDLSSSWSELVNSVYSLTGSDLLPGQSSKWTIFIPDNRINNKIYSSHRGEELLCMTWWPMTFRWPIGGKSFEILTSPPPHISLIDSPQQTTVVKMTHYRIYRKGRQIKKS